MVYALMESWRQKGLHRVLEEGKALAGWRKGERCLREGSSNEPFENGKQRGRHERAKCQEEGRDSGPRDGWGLRELPVGS